MFPTVISPEIELALLPLVLGVKVPRFVFLIKHPNHDSEEHRNDRHVLSIASSNVRVG